MTPAPVASCIDVHTHIVPGQFPAYMGRHADAAWPAMAPAQPCHRHVMLSGKVYRTVSDRAWDPTRRLEDMAQQGVDRQVLSPMPELLSYWLDGADGAMLCRYLNEQIAAMVAAAPQKFFGLGSVPLQDMDRALVELEFAVRQLGFPGVEIGTNVNGAVLGDPALEPFFAAAEALGAAVFVHPLRPTGKERLVGPANLEQILAFPSETGLAAASLLTSGVLARHRSLRIVLSHGGGTLALLLPRLQHGWRTFEALRVQMPEAPVDAACRFWVDSLVYDGGTLAQLIDRFGDAQVCVGSDFPFQISEQDPVGRIEALVLDPEARDRLLSGNALRWLGVTR
ncbi:MAG: aminocarboxymuconate-semialdehyde decarboxylase [Betaproteobacteria bacterium RIFCSPLOWO2_12_FULL_64_23]|nr:MAG: aminocarboxymuconate-semialdehyde decarboxylase [Betaproteobacteria bacterium RIFCSPLOWO2_12_FULL_64_23]